MMKYLFRKLDRIRNIPGLFVFAAGASVVVFLITLVLFLTGQWVTRSGLEVASFIATAAGFILVAAGVFLGAAALDQSQRSNDVRIADARHWLKKRQQIVAEIEYALFASPTLLDNLRPHNSSRISRREAIRIAASVIGTFRRLRDSLAGFASHQGFLLTHSVMQERVMSTTSSVFNTYLEAYTSPLRCVPTKHLAYIYPWLFGPSSTEDGVPLSPQLMLHAYTSVMVELDYLDQRVPILLATLPDEDSRAASSFALGEANAGAVLLESLVESMKDVYCHLVVMRAFLEVEWAAIFPKPVDSRELEDRIRSLLEAGDQASFVMCPAETDATSIEDNVAGFRFAHAIAQVESNSVFETDLSLDRSARPVGTEPPPRIRHLYGGWRQFVKKKDERVG